MKQMQFCTASLNDDLFFIKNKDVTLAEVRVSETGLITLVKDFGLPRFIKYRFDTWVRSRGFYKHRAHLQETLAYFKLTSLRDVLKFSKGLSLNDTFWIVQDRDLSWEDYSPFTHEFNPLIEQLMWDGSIVIDSLSSTKFSSAELGNDGALPKCWHRENNKVYLYKASFFKSGNKANEPLSEALCSQVLDRLGFLHTNYDLIYFKDRWASRCELFTSDKIMLVKVAHMFGEGLDSVAVLNKLVDFGYMAQVKELLLFDALVYNTDRHKWNYGLLLDSDTYQILGLSPIYDNGFGLFPYWTPDQCSIDDFSKRCPCKLFDTFEAGVEWLVYKGQSIDVLEKMLTFKFDRIGTQAYDQDRITEIERWLNMNAYSLLKRFG